MRHKLAHFAAALQPLLKAGDVLIDEHTSPLQGPYIGQAWCPTPTAVDRLREVGATLPAFPTLAVLRQVNHRRFCAELGQTLPEAAFVTSEQQLLKVAAASQTSSWLLKRPFSFSGRHRLRCPLPTQAPHHRKWIDATFRLGDGLQMEPWVERVVDCVQHGHIDQQGAIRLGSPAIQECDERGAWQGTRLATAEDLDDRETLLLRDAAQDCAQALAAAGYFGPFGIDSFKWRDASGLLHWNRHGDINARYTMGWHIGMRGWRPQW